MIYTETPLHLKVRLLLKVLLHRAWVLRCLPRWALALRPHDKPHSAQQKAREFPGFFESCGCLA